MEAIIRSNKPLSFGHAGEKPWISERLDTFWQRLSDRLVPFRRLRWLLLAIATSAFVARICLIQRHLFAAYLVAIYIMNQFLLFISPATHDDDLMDAAAS